MRGTLLTIYFFILLAASGQSIEQITFTGEAELLLELGHRYKSNYLTISHHEYRMAFTEKHPYKGDLAETTGEMERFHGYNWALEILPDYEDDGSLVTPIGFDYKGGFYYNKVSSDGMGGYRSTINYMNKNYRLFEDIVPGFDNLSGLQSGTISKNERLMIISTHGSLTHGMDDLYVMEYTDNGWTHMTNLGSAVNTKYQEITPYLAIDNKTLFFASDRRGGQGGYDIYMTERLDDTWKNWSKPVNVSEINTSSSETSFCLIDTDPYAYFVRSDRTNVYGDILQVPIRQNIEEDDTFVEIVDLDEGAYFKVVDGTTESSIPAELIILEELKRLKEKSGVFEAERLAGKTLMFKSKGYFTTKIKIGESVPKGENVIYLEPLTIGTSITLENVLFERASPRILSSSFEQLDILIEVMNENESVNIKLKGHTDGKGNPKSNLVLSQKRVDAVTEYLRKGGINKKRITGVGFGGKFPIASNETEETRRLNRRVEFEIVE